MNLIFLVASKPNSPSFCKRLIGNFVTLQRRGKLCNLFLVDPMNSIPSTFGEKIVNPPGKRVHIPPSLRIQVCPKKGINPTILLWGWDWDHQTYSRAWEKEVIFKKCLENKRDMLTLPWESTQDPGLFHSDFVAYLRITDCLG